jgi:hypothetical protein
MFLPVIVGLEVLDKIDKEVDSSVEFDMSVVESLMLELKELLEDDDSEAANVVEKLKKYLSGTESESLLNQVEECVSQYDFEEALNHMQVLMKTLP